MKQELADAIYQILNGFLWTIGALLAILLFAWLGFNPFK